MLPIQQLQELIQGKKVAFIGAGVSHKRCIEQFVELGAQVTLCDQKKSLDDFGDYADTLRRLKVNLSLGEHYTDGFAGQDIIMRTPGYEYYKPELQAALKAGAMVTSEVELFFEFCPCEIVAVTGSDGKTTTTTLIAKILEHAGHRVWIGGNIGAPLLPQAADMTPTDIAVVELSSFQLMTMERSADIAVVTNVAPNHLDVHKDMAEYVQAKKNVFAHQSEAGKVILNYDNAITRGFAADANGTVEYFSRQTKPENGVYLEDGVIYRNGKRIMAAADIRIPGVHNIENYMAAACAVEGLATEEDIDAIARTFAGVEHRIEFVRELDLLTSDELFSKGVSLGEGLGRLFIVPGNVDAPKVHESFPVKKPDHLILAAVEYLAGKYPKTPAILVTKDVNLRMKARSIGITSEDYITDKVSNVDIFEKSNEIFENVDPALIDRIYSSKEGIDLSEFDFKDVIHPNECFVLKSDRNSVLARYNPFTHSICRVTKGRNYGIEPRNAEQSFAFEILNDPNVKLVALTGKAGTGKTLLALAAALGKLTDYKQVLLARPVVALSNKDIGFLPGDAQEKVAPYMQPLFDNLNVIKRQFAANSTEVKRIEDMQKSEQLVIEALAFIRGRSLSEMYCIIDEAQNLTPNEIKTIITRAGEGTKMVFTGDIQQIDQPYLDSQSNGLVYMIDRMKDQNIFAHVNLVKGERSQLSELASNLL